MFSSITSKSKWIQGTNFVEKWIDNFLRINNFFSCNSSLYALDVLNKKESGKDKTMQEILKYKNMKCQYLCTLLERIIFPVFPLRKRLQEVGIPAILSPISINNPFFQKKTLGCPKYFFSISTELRIHGVYLYKNRTQVNTVGCEVVSAKYASWKKKNWSKLHLAITLVN